MWPRSDPANDSTAPSADRSEAVVGLVALRIGIGLVWALNLVFIADPANDFFGGFSATASAYAPTSLGGTGFPEFVAAHPAFFSVLIATVTGYLAVAFLLGLTTRTATVVGGVFALGLLVSQFGSTFVVPGGTDVGPMPIYLAVYTALYLGRAGRWLSFDAWWAARGTGSARVEGSAVPAAASP